MTRIRLAPTVKDVRGSLGPVYFTNRFGQPVLCRRTGPGNQQTPGRMVRSRLLRTIAAWWQLIPIQVVDYCKLLATAQGSYGYAEFTKRNMLDISQKPAPIPPRILPLTAAPLPIGDLYAFEDLYENEFVVMWEPDWNRPDNPLLLLAVEMDELGYTENIFAPYPDPLYYWETAVWGHLPKRNTTYTIFIMYTDADLTQYSCASSCVCVTI